MRTMYIIKRIEGATESSSRNIDVVAICSTKQKAISMLKELEKDPPCEACTESEFDAFIGELVIKNKWGYWASYYYKEVIVDDWMDAYM